MASPSRNIAAFLVSPKSLLLVLILITMLTPSRLVLHIVNRVG